MPNFAVILPAAGKSSRFRDKHYKKPFAPLGGKAVWLHSAERFLNRDDVKQVIVVIGDEDREEFNRKFGANLAVLGVDVCDGGTERSDSIRNALAYVSEGIELIAVHDAARPCIAEKWIDAVFMAAEKQGAAILGMPATATLKSVNDSGQIEKTVDRSGLWEAQTPQVFRRELLEKAYAASGSRSVTDDASLVEALGEQVVVVQGSPLNIKITTRDDLKLAEQILKVLPKPKVEGFSNPLDDLWR